MVIQNLRGPPKVRTRDQKLPIFGWFRHDIAT